MAVQLRNIIIACLCLLFTVQSSRAEELEPALEQRATGVFEQILSPFCPGRSLNDCPSSQAHDLKDKIRSEIKSGKANDLVLEEVFAQFGEQYRAVPKAEGFGIFAWLAPAGFLLAGIIFILVVAGKKKSIGSNLSEQITAPTLSAKDAERVRKALEE